MPRASRAEVVRMFPDYADSVLWFPGPVAYAEAGLEADLVRDLRTWDDDYYAGLQDYDWRSPELERAWLAAGRGLARRVAEALGEDFAVELEGEQLRSGRPARTPAAAAAFTALAMARRAEAERIAEIVAHGGSLAWSAYPPGDPRNDSG